MTEKRPVHGLAIVATGLALTLLLSLIWLASVGHASPSLSVFCVNETGTGCDPAFAGCYSSVQDAVDAADGGDEIRIAGGTYTGTADTVAYLTRSLTIEGGYDHACAEHQPELHSTVLDGQGSRAVVSILDAGDVTLMHLTFTHGNGMFNNCMAGGCGGGVFIIGSSLHLSHSVLSHNVASSGAGSGAGGGLFAWNSHVEMWGTQVVSNTARAHSVPGEPGTGGGRTGSGNGGGLAAAFVTDGEVRDTVFEGNRTTPVNNSGSGSGGGLFIVSSPDFLVEGNEVAGNFASGAGGGMYLNSSQAHLSRNRVMHNASVLGGGIMLQGTMPFTVSNNLVAHNSADTEGGGLLVGAVTPPASRAFLVNNTFADNGDAGLLARDHCTVTLKNNVLSGHEAGIAVSGSGTVTIVFGINLYWNETDPIVGGNAILADPRYAPGYHLRAGSPALDAGFDVPWLTVDLDGAPRPQNLVWDIGAYEGEWAWRVTLPLVTREYRRLPIFSDDFDAGGLPGAWTPNMGVWNNPGDRMRGEYALGNAWNIRSSTGSDILYEGTVNLVSGNAAGLTFRSSADGTSSYDVILDAVDGVFKLSKRPPYEILDSYTMEVTRNQPYRIKVVARGHALEAYLDGVKRLSVTDTVYPTGHMGVILFLATATYDDLEAWYLP
jgi:hypothetical protein